MRIFAMTTLFVCLSTTGFADVAVLRNTTLELPQVLVHGATAPALYRNVKLGMNANGSFSLLEKEQQTLIEVMTMTTDAEVQAPDPIVLEVYAFKSLDCINLDAPVLSWVGNTLYFAIAEAGIPDWGVCQSPHPHPIQKTLVIDTNQLVPGPYRVQYGDQELEFVLHAAAN